MMKMDAKGMTLVEMLITIFIISLLATFLIPAVSNAIEHKENAECAQKLRTAISAFELYRSENEVYPPDKTPGQTPPAMTTLFNEMGISAWWSSSTELGGYWDWDNGYHFAYSVSISNPTADTKQMRRFDALIDDGDLTTGKFRKVGVQHHYILEE